MHYWKGPNGTHFNFNSDLSGDVTVRLLGDYGHAVPAADLLAFANHVRREYGKGLDLTPGPLVAVDDDHERREFIRRAALEFWPNAADVSDCWATAKALWDAKPEDC